uniref:UTP--glucose-1-phosphate uridylyltransferase-like isoform X1 n=2 Tax=Myxine glutinosa TaxID=7769 RepID=UPI00358FB404
MMHIVMAGQDQASFKAQGKREIEQAMEQELKKLIATASPAQVQDIKKDFDGFQRLFHRFLQEKGPSLDWDCLQRPPAESVIPYDNVRERPLPPDVSDLLNQLVVVKLNGGLGTSMGCKGPKSLISVRSDNTFLDLTLQQIEVCGLQLFLDLPWIIVFHTCFYMLVTMGACS